MIFLSKPNMCLFPSRLRIMATPYRDKDHNVLYFISLYSVRNLYINLKNDKIVFYLQKSNITPFNI